MNVLTDSVECLQPILLHCDGDITGEAWLFTAFAIVNAFEDSIGGRGRVNYYRITFLSGIEEAELLNLTLFNDFAHPIALIGKEIGENPRGIVGKGFGGFEQAIPYANVLARYRIVIAGNLNLDAINQI